MRYRQELKKNRPALTARNDSVTKISHHMYITAATDRTKRHNHDLNLNIIILHLYIK